MEKVPITIIGGGVIGNALAYELSKTLDGIVVLERNKSIAGSNQSTRSSQVNHAGVYYDRRSMPKKSELSVEGNRMLKEFCVANSVPYKHTEKLIVAAYEDEEGHLDELLRISTENGVPGIKMITGKQANGLEPNVQCHSALHVPTTGIVDAPELLRTLYRLTRRNGMEYALGNTVTNIEPSGDGFLIEVEANGERYEFGTDCVINSAGLYSDEIAKMINPKSGYEINPARGEATKFYRKKNLGVRMNIYPATMAGLLSVSKQIMMKHDDGSVKQTSILPTLSHITPTFDDTITVGPIMNRNIQSREDYGSNLIPESELYNSVVKFFPELKEEQVQLHQTGIMASAKGSKDWVIEPDQDHDNFINMIGIDSPGLTSSLAIAKHVKERFFS